MAAALTGCVFVKDAELDCGGGISYRVDYLATQMGALVKSADENYFTFRLVVPSLRFQSLIPPNSSEIAALKAAVSEESTPPGLFSVDSDGRSLEFSVLYATALELWLAANEKGSAVTIGDVLPEIIDLPARSIPALKLDDSLPLVIFEKPLGRSSRSGT